MRISHCGDDRKVLACIFSGIKALLIQKVRLLLKAIQKYPSVIRIPKLKMFLVSHQLLVLTGVRYLQTAMENVLQLGDPDLESDGWILENSLAETARSNFNIIKNLGKCYQVDDDPNINVPTATAEQEVPSKSVAVTS